MRAQPNRLEDKRFLYEISDVLDTSYQRVKLDTYGDWNIFGKKGKISTDGTKAWYLYFSPESVRVWNNVKKKLKFMKVHQDGDDEGVLKLERLPTKKEAAEVKKLLKLRKRIVLTEEERAQLKIHFKSPSTEGVSSPRIDLND